MLIDYKLGQSSIVLRLKLRNSSVTTGAGLTGLTSASSGLIISTIANNEATATAYTVAAGNVETITTLGTFAAPTSGKCRFKEVDATNHPGVYEIQIADARFAVSSAKALLVSVSGATNLAECDALIPLRTVNPYAADFGLTLAKTTNITGFNDIAATAIVSAGAITTSSGAVSSVTTVGSVSGAVGSVTGAVGSVTGSVGSVTGAVGSVTGNVGGNVTGSVGSVATGGIAAASFASGAIDATAFAQGAADKVWSTSARVLTAGTNIALAKGTGVTGFTDLSAAQVENAVWDAVAASHATGGSTGAALTAAGSAGDPWSTAIPGAYGAGTAGKILGDNLNATVSSRMATFTLPTNFDLLSIDADGAADANVTKANGSAITTASAPANFSALAITSGGAVTVGTNSDKTGYALSSAGMDAVVVETGVNARQALSPILAASAGLLSGAGTGTITIKGGNVATTRIVATTDGSGNRSAITLTLPS